MGLDVKASGYGKFEFSMSYTIYNNFKYHLIQSIYDSDTADAYVGKKMVAPARSILGVPKTAVQADLMMLIDSGVSCAFTHEMCARLCTLFKKTRSDFELSVDGDNGWMRVYDYFIFATQMGSENDESYMKFQ